MDFVGGISGLRRAKVRRALGYLALISLAATGSTLVAARATAAEARKLTLDEALDLARRNNRDLRAARARLKQTEVGIEQAKVALFPIVTAQGKYTHNYKDIKLDLAASNQPLLLLTDAVETVVTDPVLTGRLEGFKRSLQNVQPITITPQEQLDAVLNVNVPLIVPSAYAGLSAANKTYEAGEASYDATVAQVLIQTAQAFYLAAGSDELRRVRQHAIQVAKETLDNAQARFANGVVNRVEVSRAEIALLRAQQAEIETADTQATSYRTLTTILAIQEPFRVDPPPAPAALPGKPEELSERALSLRPEAVALVRTIAAADSQENAALWRWSPTLSAFGLGRAFNYGGFSGDKYAWAIGATLDWLIYDGSTRDVQRHLVQAQRIESEARLALLRDTVHDEIFNAAGSVNTRRQALQIAQRSVELSTETLELVRAQHDAGTVTQIDLLQAQDSLVAAEVAVTQARFDLAVSSISLERAAGLFPARKE